MSRPFKCRNISRHPTYSAFKPQGIPAKGLDMIVITLDEFEAVHLADGEHLYHAEAADRMNVSRQTFDGILDSAHTKIADALVNGKILFISGGHVTMSRQHQHCGCYGGRCRHGGGGGKFQAPPVFEEPIKENPEGISGNCHQHRRGRNNRRSS